MRAARHATRLPVAVGSGVDPANIKQLWSLADVFIVGSYIKVRLPIPLLLFLHLERNGSVRASVTGCRVSGETHDLELSFARR